MKPFPQYNGISDPWLDVGNSTYNSLQVSLNHRFAHGLSAMVNYTFSKELDDLAGVRDPNKDFLEKGPGTIDHAHVAQATFVYQLPFGAGHNLNSGSKVVSGILSHWQLSGLFTFSTGAPLTITGTCTGGGIIDASCYPNYNPNFSGSVWQNGTPGTGNLATTAYLNKAAFVDPPAYTAGNIARSAPFGLFAPHIADFDMSVRREFAIREKIKLAFQADAFNINNAVHFAAPGTDRFRYVWHFLVYGQSAAQTAVQCAVIVLKTPLCPARRLARAEVSKKRFDQAALHAFEAGMRGIQLFHFLAQIAKQPGALGAALDHQQ